MFKVEFLSGFHCLCTYGFIEELFSLSALMGHFLLVSILIILLGIFFFSCYFSLFLSFHAVLFSLSSHANAYCSGWRFWSMAFPNS